MIPLLNARPARIHRRSMPPTPGGAYAVRAERHRDALARCEPVVVRVFGRGHGWYVEVVGDGKYDLWQDGVRVTVDWTDVPLDQ